MDTIYISEAEDITNILSSKLQIRMLLACEMECGPFILTSH